MGIFQNLYTLLSILNLLFAAAIVFLERRNVGVTWAWIMVLLFLPGIGFFLYLILGQNLSRRKIYRLTAENRSLIYELASRQRKAFRASSYTFRDSSIEDYKSLIYMNLMSGHAVFTEDNDITWYADGKQKFDALLQDIEQAEHHVHLMYFIVRNDSTGRELLQLLARKAAEGVEVRFLYDHIGCHNLPDDFFLPLAAGGGMAAAFFPSRIRFLNIRVNYRNHRKLAIIDGKHGYVGGMNIGDEYLGLSPRFGYWRDTHLRITGSAVHQMQNQFMLDWNLSFPARTLAPLPVYFPKLDAAGQAGLQIVTSGPDLEYEQIKYAFIRMIMEAKQTISMQTPYFIPDESLLTALKLAALSGVDVRLMLPSKPDHKMVYWATFSNLSELLQAGVKCYLYERGFLHAKSLVIDGRAATIGTANVDIRSFKLNFEVNAILYNSKTAMQLEQLFDEDMKDCRLLTYDEYKARPLLIKMRESCARLLSPIL